MAPPTQRSSSEMEEEHRVLLSSGAGLFKKQLWELKEKPTVFTGVQYRYRQGGLLTARGKQKGSVSQMEPYTLYSALL